MCISKYQKMQREAQVGQVKNACGAIHSDSRAKIVTFLLMTHLWQSLKMHCNFHSKWILRSPKKQVWCKLVSKWKLKNTYKTRVMLHICSKWQENSVFRILRCFAKMSKSLFGSPRAPVERPETPPRAPWDHRMTSKWQQCMKNQWELTHFARLSN